jgi:hypothetical protein
VDRVGRPPPELRDPGCLCEYPKRHEQVGLRNLSARPTQSVLVLHQNNPYYNGCLDAAEEIVKQNTICCQLAKAM